MIEKVQPKDIDMYPVYMSSNVGSKTKLEIEQERKDAKDRQKAIADMYNSLTDKNRVNKLNIWEAARTPNNFNVRAQQALHPFMNLRKDDNVTFFDIEAAGTPDHLRTKDSLDIFAMTELSFRGTRFNGEGFVASQRKTVSMAVAPGEMEYKRFMKEIQELKLNPHKRVSEDMKRSLLDFVKYSDSRKFKADIYGKHSYMSITGHARIPVANTAFTLNAIKEMEMGLNNLYHKGTNKEVALKIFQNHLDSTGSKIGGYNIHHYDLPAIVGSTKNTSLQSFFRSAYGSSLDFYHGYSATSEDPYTLTGASVRQEHVHQNLIRGKVIKGSQKRYTYHLAADDIQANIEIAGVMNNHIQEFIQQAKTSPAEYVLSPKQLKTSILQQETELFSYQSGFFEQKTQKHMMVGRRVQDEKGKIAINPRWDNLNTPMPVHEQFVLKEFLQDVTLPNTNGKKGFGVRLDSKNITDKSVLFFSETQEELAQLIHGHFMPTKDNSPEAAAAASIRKLKIENDDPFVQYKKMFDEGGWKHMNKLYDYLNSGGQGDEWNKLLQETGSDVSRAWTQHVLKQGGSEELALKFPHMVARLEGEKKIWDSAISTLSKENLSDEQRVIALRHLKNNLDELGENKAEVNIHGGRYFDFSFGEDNAVVFNARNTEQIKNAFRRQIKGNHVGAPGKTFQRQQALKLSELIISNLGLSTEGEQAGKVRKLANAMVKEVYSGNKIETALTSMANLVRDQVESKGKGSFVREVTNKMTPERIGAIHEFSKKMPIVMQHSIEFARSYTPASAALESSPALNKFLEEQDKRITALFHENFGFYGMNSTARIDKAVEMAGKYKDLTEQIIKSYSTDFHTQLFFKEGKGPLLLLSDKKAGVNLNGVLSYNEIAMNNKIAVVELPYHDKELQTLWGGQQKVSTIRSGIRGVNQYHSTSATDALNMLLYLKNDMVAEMETSRSLGEKNGFLNIERALRSAIGKKVNPTSTHANRKIHHDDANMHSIPSRIAGEVRAGRWNIEGYAESWYREYASSLGLKTNIENILERVKKNGTTFFDEMGSRAQAMAQSGHLLDYVQSVSKLRGTMNGLNVRATGKGYAATGRSDSRAYIALGNFLSDVGENTIKTPNYRKLDKRYAEAALEEAGINQSYRYNNSFITDKAYYKTTQRPKELGLETDWRGLTTQSGYMTDDEIAFKLKDTNTMNKYKEMINKAKREGRISDREARKMISTLEMGLSTREGLAFMDNKLFAAFDGLDEVRINIDGNKIQFHQSVEDAIEKQAAKQDLRLANGAWKTRGVTFDKPIEIDINNMFDEKGNFTLGDYWVNNIKGSITEGKRINKSDKVSIIGFNPEDPFKSSLVLGRERKERDGIKLITEPGFRGTFSPMLGEVISDLYGVEGTEMVISHLGKKKGSNDMASLIRGYDTVIRKQFSGELQNRLSGYTAESALSEFYTDVNKIMGIETEVKDGQYLINHTFALNNSAEIKYEDREKLSSKWMGKLGLEREAFAEITMAHDIAIHHRGVEGSAKVTLKEFDKIKEKFAQAGITKPGEISEYQRFLRKTVYGADAAPELKREQEVFQEIVKVAGNLKANGWTPGVGDAVIDYTAEGISSNVDINAEIKNGILHVSKDSFESIPQQQARGQMFTIADYTRTVLNAGGTTYQTSSMNEGKRLQQYLNDTQGAAYMKLPDFASREYIPLVDVNAFDLSNPTEDKIQYLDSIKGSYARIARDIDRHSRLAETEDLKGDKLTEAQARLEKRINKSIDDLMVALDPTSKDRMAKVATSQTELSSIYSFGGVNPYMTYKKEGGRWTTNGPVKEGEVYLGRESIQRQVGGKASSIIESWGVDTSKINGDLTEWMLDNWNKYDTFAATKRAPYTDTATIQVLKLKMSDSVYGNRIVGLPSMAERISGDHDGDELGVDLSHYAEKDTKTKSKIIDELRAANKFETAQNELMSQRIMDDMEKDFRTKIGNYTELGAKHEDVIKVSNAFFSNGGLPSNLTLGNLHGTEVLEHVEKALQTSGEYDNWGISKNGWTEGSLGAQDAETVAKARAHGFAIGSTDNTRIRMTAAFQALSESRYKSFKDAEGIRRYTANDYRTETSIVGEFLREYSQKAISTKHLENNPKAGEMVIRELYDMIDSINNPSTKMDYDTATKQLLARGVFKDDPFIEIPTKDGYKGSNVKFIKDALQILNETESFYAELGMKGPKEPGLLFASSQGTGFKEFSNMIYTGNHIPGAEATEILTSFAKKAGFNAMEEKANTFQDDVKRIYERKFDNISSRLEDASSGIEIMNSVDKVKPNVIANSEVPIHRTIRDGMDDSLATIASKAKSSFSGSAASMLGVGLLSFGALWATNALMKNTPTPEGLQEMAPVPQSVLGAPTARVTPNNNGEYINLQINARAVQQMNHNDIAAMINNEIMAMSGVKMNTSVNVNDNSQKIDGQWLQSAVANAMNKGYAY